MFEFNGTQLPELLEMLKREKIPIYHLKLIRENTYQLMTLHRYRRMLLALHPDLYFVRSTGLLYYALRFVSGRFRFAGMAAFFITYAWLGQFVWCVSIEGSRPDISARLEEHLIDYGLQPPARQLNKEELQEIQKLIQKDYASYVDWMSLELIGHTYQLQYTPKVNSEVQKEDYKPLIATQDGLVDRIEVEKGNVLVTHNQYVRKGEILVDNCLTTTSEEIRFIPVEGKVFAYTWKIYEASMPKTDQTDAFSELRLAILEQVQADLGVDDRIEQENVLQYATNEGKITLKIHFTLYQNIASKGD